MLGNSLGTLDGNLVGDTLGALVAGAEDVGSLEGGKEEKLGTSVVGLG